MRYFWVKIAAIAAAATVLFVICFKTVCDTSDNRTDSHTAYNLSSWLAKNNVIIDKDIIDTSDQYVYSIKLESTLANHRNAAEYMLGGNVSSAGANTYKGENGTVVFSEYSFLLTPEKNAFASEMSRVDKYNIGKRSEKIISDMGFELGGCVISTTENGDYLKATIYKTIASKPIFDDCIELEIWDKELHSVSGTWYVPSTSLKDKRRAKSAANALSELLQRLNGSGKITIKSMTLGYKMVNNENNFADVEAFWRFEIEGAEDEFIPA